MSGWSLLLQQLANGLTLGAIYALIALGYTMVYGVIQLINFAHGEVFMVGAYLALTVFLALGLPAAPAAQAGVLGWALGGLLLLGALAAMMGCGLLGLGIERLAYRPLRQAQRLAALITAIGVSFFLQNAVMLLYGATDRRFPALIPGLRWEVAGATVTLLQMLIWVTSGVLMVALQVLVMSTTLGKAMRAAAQDPQACRLLGIPVDRVIAVTFVLGSALAAVGGMLFGLYYNTVNFHDGYLTGLKAFTAAVLGGIGNVPGAMVGGLVLGVLEALGAGYLSAQWKNVFAFVVLVALLLFRPTGLLGERVSERA
ncbi:MAG: branched-chain amino acid ABC transporter permease [Candidatus Omnitrophica bacterium]|nr:branched-chain amino acid ABC transporter permease [Candidatus Omnitrophota bacterium]